MGLREMLFFLEVGVTSPDSPYTQKDGQAELA